MLRITPIMAFVYWDYPVIRINCGDTDCFIKFAGMLLSDTCVILRIIIVLCMYAGNERLRVASLILSIHALR